MKDDPLAPTGSRPSHDSRPPDADESDSNGPEPLAPGRPVGHPFVHNRGVIRVGEVAALLLLGLAVLLLYVANAAVPVVQVPGDTVTPAQNLELRFQAEFELGIRQLFPAATLQKEIEALDVVDGSSRRLDARAQTPRERIALVPVRLHLAQAPPGAEDPTDALHEAVARLAALAADESLDARVREEAYLFADLLDQPNFAPSDEQRDLLLTTYGFFGRLVLDPDAALDEARRTALVFYALAGAALLAFLVGSLALVYLLHRLNRGRLQPAYRRRQLNEPAHQPSDRLPFLETALLFLVAVTVVGGLVGLAMGESGGGHWFLLLNWIVVAVLFWPLARGRSWSELRRGLGWHRGQGVLVEMAAGLLAYLAAMPLLAAGLAVTLVFTRFTEQPPHHPIVDWLQEAGTGGVAVVVILAVVWAPLLEESLFRGGLYHYFRGRLGIFSSVLVVSLVFAAIHPQGLAGIPFLTTLAIVLGLTREWRDSIVASITLHMVHNGFATILLLALFS